MERLSGLGLNQEQIAYSVGTSPAVFHLRKEEFPEIQERLKKGKSDAVAFVTSKLMELVRDKNLGAICFYLKTQAQWKENDPNLIKVVPLQVRVDGKIWEFD
jgi:hypothetical protein